MPSETDKIQKLKEETDEGQIPYISKSRLKTHISCPRDFWWTYIKGHRAEENYAMKQGTRVHLVFETYYKNLEVTYGSNPEKPLPENPYDLTEFLPEDTLLYADWQDMVANFFTWELKRLEAAEESVLDEFGEPQTGEHQEAKELILERWLPSGIEAEAWDDDQLVPWMGFADVIVPAASVPEVDDTSGAVIVDFKTGKTPDDKYRDKGIYTEGEFYGMVFREEYQVKGVAGYYPKNNDFIVSPLSSERRAFIRQEIADIQEAVESTPSHQDPPKDQFPMDTGPLCHYYTGKCDHYDRCDSAWGEPFENEETFRGMVDSGYPDAEIADELGTTTGAVNYAKYKLDLY